MFGHRHRPPRPPDHEPVILVLLAILIAALLTAAYGGIMYVVERVQAQGVL